LFAPPGLLCDRRSRNGAGAGHGSKDYEIGRSFRKALSWLLTNQAGIILFLFFASAAWISPEERSAGMDSGGGILIAAMLCVPLLAIFLIINFVWLGVIIVRANKSKDVRSLAIRLGVAAIWFIVVRVSGSQTG